MATIKIEGTVEQIKSVLDNRAQTKRSLARDRNRARRERLVANRRIIKLAFDLIRHDPKQQNHVSIFVRVLGGRLELTAHHLGLAKRIIKQRG